MDIVRSVKAQIDEQFEKKQRPAPDDGAEEAKDGTEPAPPDAEETPAEVMEPAPPRPSLKERLFGGRPSPSLLKSSRMRRKSAASETAVSADKWASLEVFHSAAAAHALQTSHHASFFDHV
jgi:type IV secretory pathway VirB10-like protein